MSDLDAEMERLVEQQDWHSYWALVPEWTRQKRAWLITVSDEELKTLRARGDLLGDYARAEFERRNEGRW
jgi:hypothetical protein